MPELDLERPILVGARERSGTTLLAQLLPQMGHARPAVTVALGPLVRAMESFPHGTGPWSQSP